MTTCIQRLLLCPAMVPRLAVFSLSSYFLLKFLPIFSVTFLASFVYLSWSPLLTQARWETLETRTSLLYALLVLWKGTGEVEFGQSGMCLTIAQTDKQCCLNDGIMFICERESSSDKE